MKKKSFQKKLALNKETIVNLERETLGQVKGGTLATIHFAGVWCGAGSGEETGGDTNDPECNDTGTYDHDSDCEGY